MRAQAGTCQGPAVQEQKRKASDGGAKGDEWALGRPVRSLIGYACISTAEGDQVLDRQFGILSWFPLK